MQFHNSKAYEDPNIAYYNLFNSKPFNHSIRQDIQISCLERNVTGYEQGSSRVSAGKK